MNSFGFVWERRRSRDVVRVLISKIPNLYGSMTKDLTCHYGIQRLTPTAPQQSCSQRFCLLPKPYPSNYYIILRRRKKGKRFFFFFFKGNLTVDINSKFARRKEVQLSWEFGVVVKVERE